MTDKSEDQVWICSMCLSVYKKDFNYQCHKCKGILIPYQPHSKYLALKSDLAVAVEALKQLNKDCCCVLDHSWQKELTEEALGKIGEK